MTDFSQTQASSVLPVSPTPWWKSGLFWRTFFLVGILLMVSMGAWIASFRIEQRGPRARQVADQIVSLVTITRAALAHSAPELRRELLFDLVSNEGIRIYPLEPTDKIDPVTDGDDLMQSMLPVVQQKMGEDTIISPKVNDMPGFWISFQLEEDDVYWLRLDNGRLKGISGLRWLGWGGVVLLLSLIGAGLISRLLNEPLARLAYAARLMANGKSPEPLPEKGVSEIREANHSFNQMVKDLERVDSDRTEILAGISHDLRTPLSRMRLELELSSLSEESKDGMQSDITQMDAIVGQFLDYARLNNPVSTEILNLGSLMHVLVEDAQRHPDMDIDANIEEGLQIAASEIDIRRLFNNILTNIDRYGRSEDGTARVDVVCRRQGDGVLIEIADHGQGVPEDSFERMLRPFTRMDDARGQANGSGLGLAIVLRIAKRYRGRVSLDNRKEGGLIVSVLFPSAPSKK